LTVETDSDGRIDPDLFRSIMSRFPAGVVVVTANDPDGLPRGLTVSAFCPVSLDPPLVLVCIDKTSNTLPAIRHSGGFTVNILGAGRQELARLMASKAEDKFGDVEWRPTAGEVGGPILHVDSAAHAVCRIDQSIEAGDHWVFIGRVVEGGVEEGSVPLVYSRRAFFELADE
jgi:flavin reductase (DIM6/NTAB) family NADH-FMN oxidoreductase RutF